MKFRCRLAGAVFALALAPLALHAQPEAPKTPLGTKMNDLNIAFRALGPQVADPAKNDSSIKLVTIMETNAKAALAFEPAKKAQIAADSQPQFVEGFQRELKVMVGLIERLNVALKAGKNPDAVAIMDSVRTHQRSSHMVYRIRPAGGRGGSQN